MEPLEQVSRRFLAGLGRYAADVAGDLVVVSHGGAINAVLRALSQGETGTGKVRLGNASVQVVAYNDGNFRLLAWNLPPEEVAPWLAKGERAWYNGPSISCTLFD